MDVMASVASGLAASFLWATGQTMVIHLSRRVDVALLSVMLSLFHAALFTIPALVMGFPGMGISVVGMLSVAGLLNAAGTYSLNLGYERHEASLTTSLSGMWPLIAVAYGIYSGEIGIAKLAGFLLAGLSAFMLSYSGFVENLNEK